MRTFIFENIGEIKGLKPIATAVNKYGVKQSFFLIGESEIKHLENYIKEKTEYKNCISEPKEDFLKWYINNWAVAIVDTTYRLNQFLNKNGHDKLKSYTYVQVV